ncbi:MAG: hypothetical protein IT547_07115 [Hyphomonadaceae bacterium]|nr:hypothetical protein [Hyphomonadaceae bacterium]
MAGANFSRLVFTALAGLLSRASGLLTFIILTPLFFAGLGERSFGIFQFAQRLSAFGGVSNLGATSYLKIRLNSFYDNESPEPMRQAVGECIVQWFLLSPLLLAWCVAAVALIGGRNNLTPSETVGAIALIAITPLAQLLTIPQVALFSAGLGYRGTFVTTSITFCGYGIAAIVAKVGGDIVGIAIVLLATTVVTGLYLNSVASRLLGWWSIRVASVRSAIRSMSGSIASSLVSLTYLGLQQLEALAFGMFLGPVILGRLIITCALVQAIEIAARLFMNAATPMLAQQIAAHDHDRLSSMRREGYAHACLIYALASPGVVMLGPMLIQSWIPTASQLNPSVVTAVLILSYFRVLSQFDGLVLDQARHFYRKVLSALAVVAIPTTCLLTLLNPADEAQWYWGLPLFAAAYHFSVSREALLRFPGRAPQLFPTYFPVSVPLVALVAKTNSSEDPVVAVGLALAMTLVVGLILSLDGDVRRSVQLTYARLSRSIRTLSEAQRS